MSADLEIRPLRQDEFEAAVGVWTRARWDAQPWLEERMGHSAQDDLRFFRDVLVREFRIWVAEEHGEIVGVMALGEGTVEQLHVEPRCQRRGIGRRLLDLAKEGSPAGLRLFTHQRNARARAFYEEQGFRLVRLGTSPPPESEPDVEYHWARGQERRFPLPESGP